MILKKITMIFFIATSLVTINQTSYSQPKIQKGFKIGIDFPNYLSNESGMLTNDPSISFGYFTGINLFSTADDVFLLGLEFNYTRINHYRINFNYPYAYEHKNNLYVFDQKFRYAFIEIGLLPEYHRLIYDNTIIGFYIGPSIGIGTQELYSKEISHTVIDTLNYNGEMYYPFGEYNMDRYKSFACFNLGVRYYFSSFMIDFRYRYTYVSNLIEVNHFKTIFLQIGVTF